MVAALLASQHTVVSVVDELRHLVEAAWTAVHFHDI